VLPTGSRARDREVEQAHGIEHDLARAAHQPHRDTDVEPDAEPAAHRHSTALLHPERPWDDDGGRPDRLSEPLDDQRVSAGDRRTHQPEEQQTSAAHATQLSMCQHPAPTKLARSLR